MLGDKEVREKRTNQRAAASTLQQRCGRAQRGWILGNPEPGPAGCRGRWPSRGQATIEQRCGGSPRPPRLRLCCPHHRGLPTDGHPARPSPPGTALSWPFFSALVSTWRHGICGLCRRFHESGSVFLVAGHVPSPWSGPSIEEVLN